MLKTVNNNFYDVLFSKNKIISYKNDEQKNISEELLTIRTLILSTSFINETEEFSQLEKIMAACKLQKRDYKVEHDIKSWSYYRNHANIKEVLLFGITEKEIDLDLNFIENRVNRFDGKVFIKTSTINAMQSNQHIKNDLWQNALKPYFIN